MKIKSLTLIIICFFSLTSLTGCIDTNEKKPENSDFTYTIHYDISINSSGIGNGTIFLPIPLTKDNSPILLINELIIDYGNVTYHTRVVDYGLCIQIDYTSDFHLIGHKELDNEMNEKDLIYKMSMGVIENNNDMNYVYFNSSILTTPLLNYHVYENYQGPGPTINTKSYHNYEWEGNNLELKQGWQKVELLKEWIIKN